jgi:hypothetical protein
VLLDNDAVVLRDGTRISGTILCAGQAAVTILTSEGEKTIPREQIERVIQNADAGLPTKFPAEPDALGAHKHLIDVSGALPPPPKKAEEPKGPDIVTALPPAPEPAAKAEEPIKPKLLEPAAPVAPKGPAPVVPLPPAKVAEPEEPPAKAVAPAVPGKAPAEPAPKVAGPRKPLPPITFPKTQAEIHALLEKLQKEGTLNDYLADPAFRDGFRQAVREAFKGEAPKPQPPKE